MSPSSRSLRSDNCRRNLSMQKSWNLWKNHLFKHTLKIKRYSQFVQVLHNCNFYDSPICHKDAEDGSGRGPHVRMQLYNCPLPSIQLSCIENYAAHTGLLLTLPPMCIRCWSCCCYSSNAKIQITHIESLLSMRDQTMKICKNILTK